MSGVCSGILIAGFLGGTGCVDDRESDRGEESIASSITLDPNASYQIVGVQSGKCVGVVGDSTASNVRLEIRTCSGNASQRFRPEAAGGGFFRLHNELSGLCMDVSGVSTLDGAAVIQFTCNTGPNQQWSFTDLTSGSDRLTARHSGKVLDVTGAVTPDGTLLEQWASNNGTNQQFTINEGVAPLQ
jgi:hypothetical protein